MQSRLQSQPKNPGYILYLVNTDPTLSSPPRVSVTFLRICQLFPPVSPVPGDLTEATVDPEAEGDGNDPDGIEEEDAGRHKYLNYDC